MTKTYKIKIKPNKKQIEKINNILGTLRYLYNEFISLNIQYYNETKKFIFGYDFDKYVNNVLSKDNPWIKECSSKARKDIIMTADKTLKKFIKKKIKFLRFKSKRDSCQSYFFIKDSIQLEGNKIKLPILKWVKLCEKDYLPLNANITSGRVVKEDNNYYICLYIEEANEINIAQNTTGIGIDLGIKKYATIYNGKKFIQIKNINKDLKVIQLEEKIKRINQIISNKININRIKKEVNNTNVYSSSNIKKLRKKNNNYQKKLNNIRIDFIKKICNFLVRTKPEFISIEDLSILNMLQYSSSNLADKIAKCKFNYFESFLIWKCKQYGIELRQADKFFKSSKTCCKCGHIEQELTLKDRIYKCPECGNKIDRDENAALNLFNLREYKLIA